MIPSTSNTDIVLGIQPSKNYKMHIGSNIVNGDVNEKNAMQQVIYKILSTERYEHVIYSSNYGITLKDLIGMPINYVTVELEVRISSALMQDNRIKSVDSFLFDTSKRGVVAVQFIAHTIFGDVDIEKVVNV